MKALLVTIAILYALAFVFVVIFATVNYIRSKQP